jgi:glycerol-3-phosphate dehydrogenase
MRFVLPYVNGLRPRWMLRTGLFLYDHIGGRKALPPTEPLELRWHEAGAPLKPEFVYGYAYSDCRVDDARLVVLNARDAADRGATVRTRCEVQHLEREGGEWAIQTDCGNYRARSVVNATGPSVLSLLGRAQEEAEHGMRLVRGSHIVVPRLFEHDFAYFFQLPDGRIFFAIPYEGDFTLIGTTDVDHKGGLADIHATEEEVAYLCEGANRFFCKSVTPGDVVWSFSGVRPLLKDGSGRPVAATRGYRLDLSDEEEGAPILSVFGGKITTYRHLAEEAMEVLGGRLPELKGPGWTGGAPLPGGNFPMGGQDAISAALLVLYPFLDAAWAERLTRSYGTLAETVLGDAKSLADCGRHFGHGLTEREVDYLKQREWAVSAEDILWRRSKLGLRFTESEAEALAAAL